MSGRDYTAARLRVAAAIGLMLAAAPSVSLPSLGSIDWPDARTIASSVHLPHLAVTIAVEVTP